MKKLMMPLAFFGLSVIGLAQDNGQASSNSYNKLSIELNGGVNKATNPFTKGYYSDTPSFYHVDLGVRYMLNNKFGLKLDGGYDILKNADSSKEFESEFYRVSLQGVANLGRIMSFETWTNTLGLLSHTGIGYSTLFNDNFYSDDGLFKKADESVHFILGITGQVKLSDRFALIGDFTMINIIQQNNSFDGKTYYANSNRGFDGTMYNATLGLTYYIGRNDKHTDWGIIDNNVVDGNLAERVAQIEEMLKDTDGDGVADYLDQEPNSATGAMVDTKGVTIDANGNGIPDAIEEYINNLNGSASTSSVLGDPKVLQQLINSGIINVYFDYNSSTPLNASIGGVDFVIEYLKMNSNANIDIIGYADPTGEKSYNLALSQKRADAVKRVITNAGISPSRLNAIGKGVDSEFNTSSVSAHQLARRVIFKIK